MERQKSQKAKTILEKQNNVGELTLSGFKTYYSYTQIKTVWYWQKDRHMDRKNRIESRNRLAQIWPIDFFTKVQWGKTVFSTNDAGVIGHSCAKM